jgi:hypothetical protein
MRKSHVGLGALALAAAFLAGNLSQTPVAAQRDPQPGGPGGGGGPGGPRPPRFQISAYGGKSPQGEFHGCYTVDTATGELWVTAGGQPAKRVSEPLRQPGGQPPPPPPPEQ